MAMAYVIVPLLPYILVAAAAITGLAVAFTRVSKKAPGSLPGA
jgi:hypothetical protein